MSDIDIESELLGLIGEPSKRASGSGQKQRSSSSKRRKAAADSDDDSGSDEGEPEVESEEDDEGVVRHASARGGNSYPLEGLFRDEEDKERIYSLPELEREGILAEREAEKQKQVEKGLLDQMVATQRGNAPAAADNVSGAAKRKHTATGTTNVKKKKLEELSKKREEKSKKASKSKKRSVSPSRSAASSSDESSDDDEHQRRDIESSLRAEKEAEEAENISLADVQGATIRRAHLMTMLGSPWFEEYVTGGYVRVAAPPLPGSQSKKGGYLVCEVIGVSGGHQPYLIDSNFPHVKDDRRLTLKHGEMEKAQPMNVISSSDIQEDELGRWMRACFKAKVPVPRKSQLLKKRSEWTAIKQRILTDADITANLKRKKASGLARSPFQEQQIALNRRRGEYNMALKRQDWDTADALASSIAELEEQLEASRPASGLQTPGTPGGGPDEKAAVLGAGIGGDAIWRMKERNKEILRQALEAAKKEAAAAAGGAGDKPRKKVKLDASGSSQLLLTQPMADSQDATMADPDELPPNCSAARGIPLPQWKSDRFGFGKVTSTLALDLGPGF